MLDAGRRGTMISRQEAEAVAAEWARRESLRRGYECTPEVREFDLGYLVWTRPPAGVLPVPGDGTPTVIDRDTGELSSWPALPDETVQERYRRHRAGREGVVHTADPAVELRRSAHRLATPATVAHLTVERDRFVVRGAKGDQELRHHPLVREYLDDLPAGHLVRGGERHAELVAVSDALHEHDRRRTAAGQPPLGQEQAREALAGAVLEIFRVRDPGDPLGGPGQRACESCIRALVYFGVLPWSELVYTEEWSHDSVGLPPPPVPMPPVEPGRFPPGVAETLFRSGWMPGFANATYALAAIERTLPVAGRQHRHEVFPAAQQTLTAFPGVESGRRGVGEQVWIRRFSVNPPEVAHTADTLADFGRVIGSRLFPIGTESGDSILTVDEQGRIFALDQAGEWFLGPDIDTALTTLLLGRAAPRVHDDGTW
jgi:hypothetical protein